MTQSDENNEITNNFSNNVKYPEEPLSLHCTVCELKFNSQPQAVQHYTGAKHFKNVNRTTYNAEMTNIPLVDENISAMPDTTSVMYSNLKCDEMVNVSEATSKNFNMVLSSDPVNDAIIKNLKGELSKSKRNEVHCDICDVVMESLGCADAHFKGKKHLKRLKQCSKISSTLNVPVKELPTTFQSRFECSVCEIFTTSSASLEIHKQGSKHRKALNALSKSAGAGSAGSKCAEEMPGRVSDMFYCSVCNVSVMTAALLKDHLNSEYHKKQQINSNDKQIEVEHLQSVRNNFVSEHPIGPADYPPNLKHLKQKVFRPSSWGEQKALEVNLPENTTNTNSYGFIKAKTEFLDNKPLKVPAKKSWKDKYVFTESESLQSQSKNTTTFINKFKSNKRNTSIPVVTNNKKKRDFNSPYKNNSNPYQVTQQQQQLQQYPSYVNTNQAVNVQSLPGYQNYLNSIQSQNISNHQNYQQSNFQSFPNYGYGTTNWQQHS